MATSSNFSTSNQYIKYRIVVTENSTSIPNNTSSVNVKVQAWRTNQGYTTDGAGTCYVNIDGTNYSNSWEYGDKPLTYNSYTVLFDKTVTIPHNADGSKTIYVSAYISHSRFSSNSQGFNVALTTIPRQADLTAAPNFYDTDNPTINYSNPAGNAVSSLQACISLTGARDDIAYRDINKTSTSYTFNLTQAERNTLLAACPNSNTLSVRFYVKTVLAGQTYYSILTRTMTVKNANPTISGPSYYDSKSSTTAITQNNQLIIQNNSNVTFKFSTLAALKSASLRSLSITVNAVTVNVSLSGTNISNKTVNFGTINSANNLSASFTLTDSRGNKTTSSLNITILAWSLPTAIISLKRKSNYYNETYFYVNADYSSLNNQNTISIQYQYKERSGSTWSALTTIQDETTYTLSFDNTKAYNFKIIVTDRIGSTTYNTVLQVGIPIIFFDRVLRCVGVGTIPSESNMFEADRRISLKNVNHETVADLWSTDSTDDLRSAFLKLYGKNGDTRAFLTGYNGGQLSLYKSSKLVSYLGFTSSGYGFLSIYDNNGTSKAQVYANAQGGQIFAANSSDTRVVSLGANTYNGGGLYLYNNSDGVTVQLFTGSAGDGTLNLFNSSGTNTINCAGQTGKITCVSLTQTSSRKVKENIKPLDPEESFKILELVAVSFDYKNKDLGTDKRGFIAEDVAEIIPQLVTPETEESNAALDYIEMIPYLQAVIKEQDKRIKALEDQVSQLLKKLT